jgi:ribosomal-protein-alanine N-acetyltransferase
MILNRRKVKIETERLTLRPPVHGDHRPWSELRAESEEYLTKWEPAWAPDHLTRRSFTNRVYWAQRSVSNGSAIPLFLFRREDDTLVGAITLDNIRRGPAQAGTIGYWTGERFARHGYMREAINAVVHHAFHRMDLSRIEAACLPENAPSRRLLESCGFKYEGVAQSYLQIHGRWRTHVLYASLRMDRRGKTDAG